MFSFLLWPLAIIGGIIYFTRRRKHGYGAHSDFFEIAFSKEDFLSQIYYLMALCFLGVTLFAFNRDLGDLLEWQTVILITALIGIAGAYFFKALYVLPFSLISICTWYGVKAADWCTDKDIKGMVVLSGITLLFILFYILGKAHLVDIKFKRFSLVYNILGLISATGVIFALSTKMGLDGFSELTTGKEIFLSWQAVAAISVIIAILLGAFFYSLNKKLILKSEASFVAILAIMFIIFLFIPEQNIMVKGSRAYFYSNSDFSSVGIIWAFFFNILIFFHVVAIVLSGYINRESWLINLGAFFLFLFVIIKYFDWFFTFFDKSIFFISAGIMLFLVGGLMEKGRRYMLKAMEAGKSLTGEEKITE